MTVAETPPVSADIHGDSRQLLEAMGEAKVRRAMDQGALVWHLHQPALVWLDEIDAKKEKADAAAQG